MYGGANFHWGQIWGCLVDYKCVHFEHIKFSVSEVHFEGPPPSTSEFSMDRFSRVSVEVAQVQCQVNGLE